MSIITEYILLMEQTSSMSIIKQSTKACNNIIGVFLGMESDRITYAGLAGYYGAY